MNQPHPVQEAKFVFEEHGADGDPLDRYWTYGFGALVGGKGYTTRVRGTEVVPYDPLLNEIASELLYCAMALAYELGVKAGKGE